MLDGLLDLVVPVVDADVEALDLVEDDVALLRAEDLRDEGQALEGGLADAALLVEEPPPVALLSLYKLTLPETMGKSSIRQASPMPSSAWTNCAMISGRCGFAKFRQLVTANGRAPTAQRLR